MGVRITTQYYNVTIFFSEHILIIIIIVFTGVSNDETHMAPPWKSMMTSKPVWAIIIAHFSENWGFYTLLTGMPTFMKDVLGYKLDQAGFLAAFPYLLMAGIVQSAGILGKQLSKRKRNSPRFSQILPNSLVTFLSHLKILSNLDITNFDIVNFMIQ